MVLINTKVFMEWCSHCCRLCQTRVETIDEFSCTYYSSCTNCGKILSDLSAPLDVLLPKKRIKKVNRRIKRGRKCKAKIVKEECDKASEDPLNKEENTQ